MTFHWDMPDDRTTVATQVHATQPQTLANVIIQKRSKRGRAYLLHDNTRPHVVNVSRDKIQELGW